MKASISTVFEKQKKSGQLFWSFASMVKKSDFWLPAIKALTQNQAHQNQWLLFNCNHSADRKLFDPVDAAMDRSWGGSFPHIYSTGSCIISQKHPLGWQGERDSSSAKINCHTEKPSLDQRVFCRLWWEEHLSRTQMLRKGFPSSKE